MSTTSSLLFILIVLGLAGLFFVLPIVPKESYPALAVMPTRRVITTTGSAQSSEYAFYGLELRFPWSGAEASERGPRVIFTFPNNISVTLEKNQAGLAFPRLLLSLLGPNAREQVQSRGGSLESNYHLQAAALAAVPRELTVWAFPVDKFVIRELLSIKRHSLTTDQIALPIYRFQVGGFSGFQMGDPKEYETTILRLFDANDQEYTFTVKGPDISQHDLDTLLASIMQL